MKCEIMILTKTENLYSPVRHYLFWVATVNRIYRDKKLNGPSILRGLNYSLSRVN